MDQGSASNGEEVMAKVILFAIVSLFIAMLFLAFLNLYARLFLWRLEQNFNLNLTQTSPQGPGSTVIGRNNRRRRFVFAQGQDDTPRDSGLDPSVLRSIPVVSFKSSDFEDGLECTVCLSDLVDGDKARVLPSCNHGFHVECIDMWFQSHSTCPLCRNRVDSVGDTPHRGSEGLSQNQNFESGHSSNQQNPSQDQSTVPGSLTESLNFPTNVLVWGDHNHVRSTSLGSRNVEESSDDHQQEEVTAVVVEIPTSSSENLSGRIDEEEPKSPMFTRLRSLKKFLSREKKGVVCIIGSSSTNNNTNNV